MVTRIFEIVKLVAPLVGAIAVAVIPKFIEQFSPKKFDVNKWWAWGIGGFVGAIIVYWTYTGNINYWWGVGGSLSALYTYWIYKLYFAFPFKRWRVTNNDEPGLRARTEEPFNGERPGTIGSKRKSWKFRTDSAATDKKHVMAVWGPYITLGKGKYRAVFRLKVDKVSVDESWPIIEINVSSRSKKGLGSKFLSARTLTANDFDKPDTYHKFPLDFYILDEEPDLELRLLPKGSGYTVTLDYVKLSRV